MKTIKFSDFMKKPQEVIGITEEETQIYEFFMLFAKYTFIAIFLIKFAPSMLYLFGGGIARHAFLQF